jgi:hypothetical protein
LRTAGAGLAYFELADLLVRCAAEEFLCPPADAAKFARAWNRAGRVPLIINRREIASAREQLVRGEFSHQSK